MNFSIDGLCQKYWPLQTNFGIDGQYRKHWPLHTNLVLTDYARNTERNTRISTIHTAPEVPTKQLYTTHFNIICDINYYARNTHHYTRNSALCVSEAPTVTDKIMPSTYSFHTNFKRFEHGMVDTNWVEISKGTGGCL